MEEIQADDLVKCITISNRMAIQTLASICYTANCIGLSLIVYARHFYIRLTIDLKMLGVDVSPNALRLACVPMVIINFVAILTDLFLVVGIENNSVLALNLFLWWTWLMMLFDSIIIFALSAFTSFSTNLSIFIPFIIIFVLSIFLRLFYTNQISSYIIALPRQFTPVQLQLGSDFGKAKQSEKTSEISGKPKQQPSVSAEKVEKDVEK